MNETYKITGFRRLPLLCLLAVSFFFISAVKAQKFTAQVSKNRLAVGEVFQLMFTINTSGSSFRAPNLSEFDVYSGPNQSTSIQYVNGSMSQSLSYSFMLAPKKEGKFTIGAASIVVNGNKIESNTIPIEVKGTSPSNNGNAGNNSNQSNSGSPTNTNNQYSSGTSNDDIFARTFVSKKNCYLGEQVVVTQKIYTRLNLRGLQNYKMPVFNGFWSQNEELRNKQITMQVENVDGIQYSVAEIAKSYLFPQRTGKLTIDPIEVDCIVRQRSSKQPTNIFDQFFGGGFEDILVKAKSKPISIDVKALPENGKPQNFNGAVGSFNMKAEVSKDKVKANESINLKFTITGKGNLKLTDPPNINFPEGFETFDPKITENYSEGGSYSGTRTYDFLVIPRQPGEFVIKDLDFSYFDPDKKTYVTLPAPEFKISVAPDPNGSTPANVITNSKNSITEKENDIRYIKTGNLNLKASNNEFFSSWKHYALCALSLLVFGAFTVLNKNIRERNSDLVAVKERKAAKLARKQLASAEKLKNQNNKDGFYQEVFIALNNYIGNKLNIAVSDLNKDNIKTQLGKRNVSESTITKLLDTLNDCEVARYAPSALTAEIQTVYNNTVQLIENIEHEAKG